MIRAILAAVAIWAGVQAAAQEAVADRVEAEFAAWANEVEAPFAALTLFRDGQFVHDMQIGLAPENGIFEMASLGKTVTALCAAKLLESGAWQMQTRSRDVLGTGPADVTVAALLTHSAGLGPDDTQGEMPKWLDKSERMQQDASLRALSRSKQAFVPGAFQYNNENYAILGAMIARQTGKSYETYCTEAVLRPAGLTTAQPSARSGAFLSWGGWEMSLRDFAVLHRWAYGPEGIVGADVQRWPEAPLGRGAAYGMGTFQRPFGEGYNFWHFGALCFPGRLNVGSYAVHFANGWQVVAAYGGCLDWNAMGALDGAIVRGVFGK